MDQSEALRITICRQFDEIAALRTRNDQLARINTSNSNVIDQLVSDNQRRQETINVLRQRNDELTRQRNELERDIAGTCKTLDQLNKDLHAVTAQASKRIAHLTDTNQQKQDTIKYYQKLVELMTDDINKLRKTTSNQQLEDLYAERDLAQSKLNHITKRLADILHGLED